MASSANSVVICICDGEKDALPRDDENQLATRWKISVKTLRRWRLDKVGHVWHKLFRYLRYHGDIVLEFERQSAQHWMTILGRDERTPLILKQLLREINLRNLGYLPDNETELMHWLYDGRAKQTPRFVNQFAKR